MLWCKVGPLAKHWCSTDADSALLLIAWMKEARVMSNTCIMMQCELLKAQSEHIKDEWTFRASLEVHISHQKWLNSSEAFLCCMCCNIMYTDRMLIMCLWRLEMEHFSLILNDFCSSRVQSSHANSACTYINGRWEVQYICCKYEHMHSFIYCT